MKSKPQNAHIWDASYYDATHHYVTTFGEKTLLPMLEVKPHETILDVGCGTGHLTAAIAKAGAIVEGIDFSMDMVAKATASYPDIVFRRADIRTFNCEKKCDAVFSNAVLHWVGDAENVANRIFSWLKPGGRFVADFGGRTNMALTISAVESTLRDMGLSHTWKNPWYFPSLGEYSTILEAVGFRVEQAFHFERPTPLPSGEDAGSWVKMFILPSMPDFPADRVPDFLKSVNLILEPKLHKNNIWEMDYVRLRVKAVKPKFHGL